jgi:hypothetical protein
MTDSELKRINRIFAQELGRIPNGFDPKYKWVRTKDLYYLIETPVDMRTPAGIYVTVNGYRKITWEERIGTGWVVAAWQAPGSETAWKAKYGNVLPYPPNGMYYPIPNSYLQSDPTEDITMEAIMKIRSPIEEGYDNILRRCKEEAEAIDAEAKAALSDEIDSDWPVFDGQPMSKPYAPHVKDDIIQ